MDPAAAISGIPAGVNRTELSTRLWKRWSGAESTRNAFVPMWDELARYVRPSTEIYRTEGSPKEVDHRLFDSVGVQANMTLAAGCVSWLTPAQTPWFAFVPPRGVKSEEAKKWCKECSEIAAEILAESNFYEAIHENFLDRGAFGTDCLMVEEGKQSDLRFESVDIKQFAAMEGPEGMADTVFCEVEFDTRQAIAKFGEDAPQQVKDAEEGQKWDQKHKFIHAIYPRQDFEKDAMAPKTAAHNMPWASVWLYEGTKEVVRVSGFMEQRAIVSRFLRWGRSVYGLPPGWSAIPDLRQLNDLVENMDVLAEVSAFPRILSPSDHEGQYDLSPNGVTFFKDANRVPREWLTGGRYDIGKDREDSKRKAIEQAFHVPLFNMWASLDNQMTAREVAAREGEKLNLFSPTFSRWITEKGTPLLRTVFSMLLQKGMFPALPGELIGNDKDGGQFINVPNVQYVSRLALAVRNVHRGAWYSMMEAMAPIVQVKPEVMDNLNFDKAMRTLARNENMPEDWITPEDEMEATRAARAEAQQQQQQMENMPGAAKAAKDAKDAGLLPEQ